MSLPKTPFEIDHLSRKIRQNHSEAKTHFGSIINYHRAIDAFFFFDTVCLPPPPPAPPPIPTKVLSLDQLSDRGVKHLEADVQYLCNVFHALDLAAPPILEHLMVLAALGRDEAVGHMAQETVSGKFAAVLYGVGWL